MQIISYQYYYTDIFYVKKIHYSVNYLRSVMFYLYQIEIYEFS
jgi:hypothetical protein